MAAAIDSAVDHLTSGVHRLASGVGSQAKKLGRAT